MKRTVTILMTSLAMFAVVPIAASAADTQAPAPAPTAVCPGAKAGEQMQRMQAMHEAMMKAATPEERAKLMSDQMALMHEGMDTLRQMPRGPMMGGAGGPGMGGGMAGGMRGGMGRRGGGKAGAQGACIADRMAMMEMMMQMMMDRMDSGSSSK